MSGATAGGLLLTRKEIVQSGAQRRQMVFDSPPHACSIDQCVAVNQDVAESNYQAKIGNPGSEGRVKTIELTQRLANDLELALHC